MNIKKIVLILIIVLFITGCARVKELSYDNIINYFNLKSKPANNYRKGYSFYVPRGLGVEDAGLNYAILSNSKEKYYLYFDLVALNESRVLTHENSNKNVYFSNIQKGNKTGYLEIKNYENNQYLIEIVYNYAKIEVMVDSEEVNTALVNAISILNSVKYDKIVISNLLKEDNLNYTEEVFDMFESAKKRSSSLDYSSQVDNEINDEVIKDTDYIN